MDGREGGRERGRGREGGRAGKSESRISFTLREYITEECSVE